MGKPRPEYDLRRRARERFGAAAKVVRYADASGQFVKVVYPGGEAVLAGPCESATLAYQAASRALGAPRRGR